MAPSKKPKTNALAQYGVTDGSIVELAERGTEGKKLVDHLKAAPCVTPAQEAWFSNQLTNVSAILATLEEQRTKITKPLNAAKRAVDALFAPATTPFKACEEVIRSKLIEVARARAVEERRLLAVAQEEAAKGNVVAAGAAIDRIPDAVETSGSTTKVTWSWRVVNSALVPDEFKLVNEKMVDALIKSHLSTGSTEPPSLPGLVFDLDVNLRRRSS